MVDGVTTYRRVARAAVAPVVLASAATTGYLLGLLLAAARTARPPGSSVPAGDRVHVSVVVPAHDEAAGIARTLGSLADQDHPRRLRSVFVVADNCSDDTATVAATHDVVVWTREDPVRRGKGHALSWALERLRAECPETDAVLVVDADCIASSDLVRSVAVAMASGERAVQAAYRVANAEASHESALRTAGFALMHDIRAAGKSVLGLSSGLFGTGMAFRSDVLREIPWSGSAVTEDTDYHLRLVRAGIVVRYLSDTAVSSDMPTTAEDARSQHLRWEGGNATLARHTAPGLLREAIEGRDVQLLHAAIERIVPSQSLHAVASTVALGGSAAYGGRMLRGAAVFAAVGQVVYVLAGLRVARVPPATWRALRHAPGLVGRRLLLAVGIARDGSPTEWVRTEREAG